MAAPVGNSEPLKTWLNRLVEDRAFRKEIGQQIQEAKARGGEFLRDLGIDPAKDLAYVGVGAVIATALSSAALSESSDRLEGLTNDLVSNTEELVSATHILEGLTAGLIVLTAVLVIRTFFP